jgi:hypothetical protein
MRNPPREWNPLLAACFRLEISPDSACIIARRTYFFSELGFFRSRLRSPPRGPLFLAISPQKLGAPYPRSQAVEGKFLYRIDFCIIT